MFKAARGEGEAMSDERMVEVCDACLCASCWHGYFYCDRYRNAGTIRLSVSRLRELNREHPSHYSVEKIREVCGT